MKCYQERIITPDLLLMWPAAKIRIGKYKKNILWEDTKYLATQLILNKLFLNHFWLLTDIHNGITICI